MASKVISIKMDQKDIERLRKYYDTLINAGFLSAETMSMNAFYKHLLLDYLEDDISRAIAAYSEYGTYHTCIDPESIDNEHGVTLANTYGLSEEMFEAYKKCVKETLSKSINRMQEHAHIFREVTNANVFVNEGLFHSFEHFPNVDTEVKCASFWENKVFETTDLMTNQSKEHEIDEEIFMIKSASISDELKEKLIEELLAYKDKLKNNRTIIQGGRFLK